MSLACRTRRPWVTTSTVLCAALLMVAVSPVAAQTAEQIEAEPIVKLQPGDTSVPGECLTQQELDLIAGLDGLRRPTVGVEGEGDDQAPFNPHYFVGTWKIEGVLPESPLGEAGDFLGTETIRHVEGCTYASTIEATIAEEAVTVTSLIVYDRRSKYMVRLEEDSRGFRLLKTGRVGGDPGGYSTHHWSAPAITRQGSQVRLRGTTFAASPDNVRLRMRMSVDGGPFTNFGTVWLQRVE